MTTPSKDAHSSPTGRVFLFVFAAAVVLWAAAWHSPSAGASAEPASTQVAEH